MTTPNHTHRLGERKFLDYPVFREVERAERREVLQRALIATACVLLLAGAAALTFA